MFFEPVESNYKVLCKNMECKKNVEVMKLALGNSSGSCKMYTSKDNEGQSCSLLKPAKHLKKHPEIKFDFVETVKLEKLDNIKYDPEKFNMMVVDVQGYELEVMKGTSKSLKSIDYIYLEVNRDEVYEGCAKIEQLDDFLKNFGFKRIETSWTGKIYGDALYIKSPKFRSDYEKN